MLEMFIIQNSDEHHCTLLVAIGMFLFSGEIVVINVE